MTTRPPLIPVEQVDREAAADEELRRLVQAGPYPAHPPQVWMVEAVKPMRMGAHDDSPQVQSYAAHRLQARREALSAEQRLRYEVALASLERWAKADDYFVPEAMPSMRFPREETSADYVHDGIEGGELSPADLHTAIDALRSALKGDS
jgi:hypothetical protein